MVRILYKDKVKLSYIPEVLVYMSHGGTSTNSLGAYVESMLEGHRALKENGVHFAWFTDLCRVFRVLSQFVTARGEWQTSQNVVCLKAVSYTHLLVPKKEANEEEDYYEKQMACIMLCWNADCIRYDW